MGCFKDFCDFLRLLKVTLLMRYMDFLGLMTIFWDRKIYLGLIMGHGMLFQVRGANKLKHFLKIFFWF